MSDLARDALVLAIDASSDDASVAVSRGGGDRGAGASDEVLADRRWSIASTLSEELLAAIDAALAHAEVSRHQLGGVVVVTGPGGYSGLRAGVATAQGLALGLDIPLAGVGRLDAEAAPHLGEAGGAGGPVVAVHDARRSGLAWAAFEAGAGGDVIAVVGPRLDEPDAVAREAPLPARWCGELTERLRVALTVAGRDAELRSGDTTSATAAAQRPSRAASAARLARLRSAFGDPANVDVLYLRPPSITRPRA
jgi:tRNA threonylcarbamoyl adenosine modification protein YeaZ